MSRALVLPFLTLALLLGNLSPSFAQTKDWPFPSRSAAASSLLARPTSTPTSTPPPYDFPLGQETWEQLSNREISREGQAALALRPQQWYHGETENFVFHYRNLSDALQVARAIEFDLWYVAQSLGAPKSAYTRESHIFVFADEQEWQKFLAETNEPKWTHSFAFHDELFLNVHGSGFDSQTLAHETTHAVVSRIYGSKRWPLWLNEGFAEYMGEASVAARHSQVPSQNQHNLAHAKMTVAKLFAPARYPVGDEAVAQLYDTSSKFVRYLYKKYPKELFPKFVDHLLNGEEIGTALQETYGNEFRDMNEFEKNFSRFTR
ncbi:MAG: hypothetical protein ABI233_07680 [Chthoniobacterales bacterium]